MKYREIADGIFVDRPNRFIAHVEVNGAVETVHVKNTGRCKELLLPGTAVRLEVSERSVGKTVVEANLRGRFGVNIIAVENDGKLIETITPDYAFKKGDIAYISGSKEALNRLSEWNGKA